MKYRLAIAAAALQVILLAFMAGEREWVMHTGREFLLRTAPIDPNDPMRGEYARLDYEISRVPWSLCRDGLRGLSRREHGYSDRDARGRRVYAMLQLNEAGLAEVAGLTDRKPEKAPFIRGRIRSTNDQSIEVRYGVEALFMQQGKALELDRKRREERPGVPLNAHIAIGSSGLAVLRDYSWEQIGITLDFERTDAPLPAGIVRQPNQRLPQRIASVVVVLKNYGPDDTAIVALPDGGSFQLVPASRWQTPRYTWVGEKERPPRPQPENIVVLKPGESHTTKIDLLQPRWFVIDKEATPGGTTPVSLRDVTAAWSTAFRIEYTPPSKEMSAGLPHSELIRHAILRSSLFSLTGSQD